MLILAVFPVFSPAEAAGFELGNLDLNILNGGVMLSDSEDFYFTQGGIFRETGDTVTPLSADDGRNLNLVDGYLYYTLGRYVCRIPAGGGEREIVHTATHSIKQLYVSGSKFFYIADGTAYRAEVNRTAEKISGLSGITGLIPTEHGMLYLTGEMFNYNLYAENRLVLSGVQSCYTDSGYLAVQIGNKNHQALLTSLFGAFDASMLEPFSIHGDISLMQLLSPDEENAVSEFNDNTKLMLDFAALLESASLVKSQLFTTEEVPPTEPSVPIIPVVSDGQRNMVKRARQLHEIEWTPLENRTQWGERGVFYAETTYTGIPYGQPVNSNGYLGYGVSIEQYITATLDNTSRFYSSYSTYNKIAPVFSTDCSGFVSYAWELSQRRTTYTIPNIAEKVGDQSVYSLQIGDCLNYTVSHVVLISGLTYDTEGNIIGVEVMEQTPVITRLTRYGAGETRSLASFQSYYLQSGYDIYRYPNRDSVTYTPNPYVPLDGEIVPGQKDRAPKSTTTAFVGGKTVALRADDSAAVIYYTLDGSVPSINSMKYATPITVYDTTKLRAIAVTGKYGGSTILEYTISVPQLASPTIGISEGSSSGIYIAPNSKLTLTSIRNATIYYTTDGTEPTTNSKTYSGPISVTSDITIKYMATANGYRQSAVSTASYKLGKLYKVTASTSGNGTISPTGVSSIVQTGSLSYTISPNKGYKINDVLVDGVSVGAVTSYSFTDVNADHSIVASFQIAVDMPFTDVAADAWYYDAVAFAYANNLFNGTATTTFSPEVSMTRGMFITVLGRYAGVTEALIGESIGLVSSQGVNIRSVPSTDGEKVGFVTNKNTIVQVLGTEGDWYKIKYGTVTGYIRNDLMKAYNGNYSDLPLNQYYSVYAQWAYLTGIANGVAQGSFRADDAISREDMAVLLYNYAIAYGKTLPSTAQKTPFSDEGSMTASAKTAIYALQQAEVINGMGNGTFAPKSTATRSQVAQIFRKYSAL